MKYEIFFLKNQSRVTSSKRAGLMVRYQSINYDVNIDSENNTIIKINAIMDKNRYLKKKKYKPKITDCNIIRNKIVANKFGYNPFTLKPNYSITEEILLEKIKNNIFNFQNLNEDQIETLISKSTIKINIIHRILFYIWYKYLKMQRYKILWVDDEIDLLKPYVLTLKEKNFQINTFNNPKSNPPTHIGHCLSNNLAYPLEKTSFKFSGSFSMILSTIKPLNLILKKSKDILEFQLTFNQEKKV